MGENDGDKGLTRRDFLKRAVIVAMGSVGLVIQRGSSADKVTKPALPELTHGKGVFASAEQLLGQGYTRKKAEEYSTVSQLTQGEYPHLVKATGTETLKTSTLKKGSAIETAVTTEILESADRKKKLLSFKVSNDSPSVKVSEVWVSAEFDDDWFDPTYGSRRVYQEDLRAIREEADVEKWIKEADGEFFLALKWETDQGKKESGFPAENFNNIARLITDDHLPVGTNVNIHLTEEGNYLGTAVFKVKK